MPKHIKKVNQAITGGLAAFLVAGLSGCDGSNDSLATKQQKCKNQEYKNQHQEDCEDISRRFGNTSVNNSHSSGSSWVPMWMMMNSHSGYSYSSGNSSKSSGFVSGGSHSSSSSGSSSGG